MKRSLCDFFALVLVFLIAAIALPSQVAAAPPTTPLPPPLPHAFYGGLLIDDAPAPAGTKVEVKGTGVITGIEGNPIYTTETGKYGIPGPIGVKLVAQGGTLVNGTTLTFYVNDLSTGQTFPFESGNLTELDLSVTICSLSIDSTEGGSVIEPGEDTYSYDCGEMVDLMAVADYCYRFTEWTGDTGTIADTGAADTTITMDDDYSIQANFELIQYTLDPSSTAGGSVIEPGEDTYSYDCGVDATITAVAETGYYFVNWTGDTAAIDDPNSANTFITMNGDYAIMANFGVPGSLADVAFNQGWNTFSTPISLHPGIDTWEEFITANELDVSMIYGYDAAAEEWVSVDGGDEIEPLYGFYIKTSAEGLAHIIPNTNETPVPTRELSRGVHLIGPAPASPEDVDVVTALETIYYTGEIWGYTMVVSPYINSPDDWAYVRDTSDLPPDMRIGRAYWVVMENAGEFIGSSSTPLLP
jgi:hypothetical protein